MLNHFMLSTSLRYTPIIAITKCHTKGITTCSQLISMIIIYYYVLLHTCLIVDKNQHE
jgi:hypothetical protein